MRSPVVVGLMLAYPVLVAAAVGWMLRSWSQAEFAKLQDEQAEARTAVEGAERKAALAESQFHTLQRRLDAKERSLEELSARVASLEASAAIRPSMAPAEAAPVPARRLVLDQESASKALRNFEDVPPLSGEQRYREELAVENFFVLLQTLVPEDLDRGIQGVIDHRLKTLSDRGARLSESQRQAYAESQKSYWPTIVTLQRKANELRRRLRSYDPRDPSDRSATERRLGELDSAIDALHQRANAAELSILSTSDK